MKVIKYQRYDDAGLRVGTVFEFKNRAEADRFIALLDRLTYDELPLDKIQADQDEYEKIKDTLCAHGMNPASCPKCAYLSAMERATLKMKERAALKEQTGPRPDWGPAFERNEKDLVAKAARDAEMAEKFRERLEVRVLEVLKENGVPLSLDKIAEQMGIPLSAFEKFKP